MDFVSSRDVPVLELKSLLITHHFFGNSSCAGKQQYDSQYDGPQLLSAFTALSDFIISFWILDITCGCRTFQTSASFGSNHFTNKRWTWLDSCLYSRSTWWILLSEVFMCVEGASALIGSWQPALDRLDNKERHKMDVSTWFHSYCQLPTSFCKISFYFLLSPIN